MKRRIYLNFLCLILAAVVSLSALLCFFFYDAFKSSEMAAVRESAGLIADLLNRGVAGDLFDFIGYGSLRITVVSPKGTVLLDSRTSAGNLENHGDRTEIAAALRTGRGETTRYSDTLATETYYYALRLDHGNVLRLSKSIESIAGVFAASLPVVLVTTALILLLADILARRLTSHIVEPLGRIDFDGENTIAYDELSPYVKKIEGQRREITAQIAALRHRADTLAAVTENMREGLILLDRNGTVAAANRAASEFFGDFGDVTQKNILHICRDLAFQRVVGQCLAGERGEISLERGGRDYSIHFSPVPGAQGGAVVFFFDTTERQRAERQRREFSANVSHELKTPLSTISALAEMIENDMAKPADIKGFASKISEQAGRLVSIIDDIIRLSEFDEGKADGERERFDLYALAESAADALRGQGEGVEIRLTGERFEVSANRRMMDELLYNLIDNGIKYNREGGSVTLALSREGGLCKIAVTDTGIGIPVEHRNRVFERFYRVDPSRSKKTGGTGLGLSIVKHIAEYHDGGVEIESAEGGGTTVICRIAAGV